MRVLFACGGTAGHINPAIAIADTLCQRDPNTTVLFAGNPNRMEAQLVSAAGYDFEPILVEGFQRKISVENIRRNTKALFYLAKSSKRARQIIQTFQPDVVVGTGGYVSGPILQMAAKLGYPTLTHESNAYPGLTTKLLSKKVDRVLLAVEKTKSFLPEGIQTVLTGNPVRLQMLDINRAQAREKFKIGEKICILSFGGSNGATKINESMAYVITQLLPGNRFHFIHATGQYETQRFPERLRENGLTQTQREDLDVREYISNMGECMAAADLVVCRSGAMTLVEIEAVGKASILIPSPNVAENHQYHNAMVLADADAAVVIEEKNLTGEILKQTILDLCQEPKRLQELANHAHELAITDGATRIVEEIDLLLAQKKHV